MTSSNDALHELRLFFGQIRELLLAHWSNNPAWREQNENTWTGSADLLAEKAIDMIDALRAAPPTTKPAIIRHNSNGTLDEVFADPCGFHLEQMDDGHWWIGVNAPDRFYHINLHSRGRIKANIEDEERHDSAPRGEPVLNDTQRRLGDDERAQLLEDLRQGVSDDPTMAQCRVASEAMKLAAELLSESEKPDTAKRIILRLQRARDDFQTGSDKWLGAERCVIEANLEANAIFKERRADGGRAKTCTAWCGKVHCEPPRFCFYAPPFNVNEESK